MQRNIRPVSVLRVDSDLRDAVTLGRDPPRLAITM